MGLERAFLARLGADCHSSVAALATVDGERIAFRAEIIAPDGTERVTGGGDFAATDAAAGVEAVAAALLARASPTLRALFAPPGDR